MSAIRVVFTSPDGVALDVSSYLDLDSLDSVTSAPESDLGILTHGDMGMTLDNSDGVVEEFLRNATPADIYDVVLERERPDESGWDRMFGGVLDLPYSLAYDDKKRTARVTAYSYTKALERTPADQIKRTLASKTVSITSGTNTLQFLAGEAADLEIGDVIRAEGGDGTSEEFTIDRIVDTDTVIVTANATQTFSSSFATVITPYHHDTTPTALLQLIATEAGVVFDDANLGSPIASFPIATPLSIAGLNLDGVPVSIVPDTISSNPGLAVTYDSVYGAKRKTTTSVTGTWADGATSNRPQLDWTPYSDTKPTTILDAEAGTNPANADILDVGADHAGGFRYANQLQGDGMHLRRNEATDLGLWDPSFAAYGALGCEYDPISGKVFVSAARTPTGSVFKYYDGTFHSISTTHGGYLRLVKYFNSRLLVMLDPYTNALKFWDPVSVASGATEPDFTIAWDNTSDLILHHTIRAWGVGPVVGGIPGCRWLTFLFERAGQTYVAIYDTNGTRDVWKFAASYRIASTRTRPSGNYYSGSTRYAYQTVYTLTGGEQLAVGYAGGEWFVLATRYAGVVRYADFEKSSCAKAAKDVATILNGLVNFDQFKTMRVVNRKTLGSGNVVADLGVPLESVRLPISENYRSSVEVTGTDRDGNDIDEIQGEQGDSARRVTVESDLINTPGMALATAITTLDFVSEIREQRNVTVEDDGTPLAVFDRVALDGREWVIYRIETDLEQRTHQLVLLELTP